MLGVVGCAGVVVVFDVLLVLLVFDVLLVFVVFVVLLVFAVFTVLVSVAAALGISSLLLPQAVTNKVAHTKATVFKRVFISATPDMVFHINATNPNV